MRIIRQLQSRAYAGAGKYGKILVRLLNMRENAIEILGNPFFSFIILGGLFYFQMYLKQFFLLCYIIMESLEVKTGERNAELKLTHLSSLQADNRESNPGAEAIAGFIM